MRIAVTSRARLGVQLGVEAVLAPVRLVGHDDHVAAVGQHREALFPAFGRELLDRREDDPARGPRQQTLQIFAALGLLGVLAEKVLAEAECRGELVVQVVAVGQHDDRRVRKLRRLNRQPGEERHQEALSRSLRVPDHADLAVAVRTARIDRLADGFARAVELVIAGDDLERPRARIAENNEIPDQGKDVCTREYAAQQGLQFRLTAMGEILASYRAPGHEAFLVSCQ